MEPINTKVAVNEFILRQIKGSGKTYTNKLSFTEIAKHAQDQLKRGLYKIGYRDGVILAEVSKELIHHFICPFVKITNHTKLKATLTKRRPDEDAYIQIRALNGTPLSTKKVDLILYRKDLLKENNENTTQHDWELISFHAIPEGVNELPMGAVTMMRNQLDLKGGTKAFYKSENWAKSVEFWQKYAILEIKNTDT